MLLERDQKAKTIKAFLCTSRKQCGSLNLYHWTRSDSSAADLYCPNECRRSPRTTRALRVSIWESVLQAKLCSEPKKKPSLSVCSGGLTINNALFGHPISTLCFIQHAVVCRLKEQCWFLIRFLGLGGSGSLLPHKSKKCFLWMLA